MIKLVQSLYDSGASHCFINRPLALQISQQFNIPITTKGTMRVRQASTVDQSQPRQLITLNTTFTNVEGKQWSTPITYTIYDLSTYDTILGMDWQEKAGYIADSRKKEVLISESNIRVATKGATVATATTAPTENHSTIAATKPTYTTSQPISTIKEYIGVHNLPANVRPRQHHQIRQSRGYGIPTVEAARIERRDQVFLVHANFISKMCVGM
ncbi:hypothetical protein BJ508DRAFT_336332 [Ascobolus immersus RN42]|uniref:Uncharacterized protein n=1 Tax=Ascobolus immersus RN42 TaxID=1160509 RepID=A0A3N4HBK5_ASCIM|nr:hypothetical protein BJ508DRAFT_336332 [Ascobolus immersus RN42]